MPKYEWDVVWRYHKALVTSMSAAILASRFAGGEVDKVDSKDEGGSGDYSDDDFGDYEVEEYIKDEEGRDE